VSRVVATTSKLQSASPSVAACDDLKIQAQATDHFDARRGSNRPHESVPPQSGRADSRKIAATHGQHLSNFMRYSLGMKLERLATGQEDDGNRRRTLIKGLVWRPATGLRSIYTFRS
jgi:hypothetical protein